MCRRCRKHALECDYGTKSGMTSASDLSNALQENLKLRRELATEVAEAKGEKLAAGRPLSGDRSEPSVKSRSVRKSRRLKRFRASAGCTRLGRPRLN